MTAIGKVLSCALVAAAILIMLQQLANARLRARLAECAAREQGCLGANDAMAAAISRQNSNVQKLAAENRAQEKRAQAAADAAKAASKSHAIVIGELRKIELGHDDCKDANMLWNAYIRVSQDPSGTGAFVATGAK